MFYLRLLLLILFLLPFTLSCQSQEYKLLAEFNEKNGLPGPVVGCIKQDSIGFLWLSNINGLSRFDGHSFKNYTFSANPEDIIPHSVVNELYIDSRGMIWLSTEGGIAVFNPNIEKSTIYRHDPTDSFSLPSNIVRDVCEDLNKGMWLCGEYSGLIFFDFQTQRFRSWFLSDYFQHKKAHFLNTILSLLIYPEDSNIVWLGTRNGLFSFNKEIAFSGAENPFKFYEHPSQKETGNMVGITKILPSYDGTFWIGTWADEGLGVCHFDPRSGKWIQNFIYNHEKMIQGVSNVVLDLEWKNEQELWVGTYDMGVGNFSPHNGKFIFFPSELDNIPVWDVFVDSQNVLWVGSGKGVKEFVPSDSNWKNNKRLNEDINILGPIITSFEVLGKPFLTDSAIYVKKYFHLKPEENSFDIEFSPLDYLYPERYQYKYRLKGFDQEWVDSRKFHFAKYSNIPAGTYKFELVAIDEKGRLSELSSPLTIYRQPALWETYWFIFIVISTVVVAMIAFFRIRVKQIKRDARTKSEFEKKIFEAREMAYRAQMNPHFIFNCLNSIDNLIMRKDRIIASDYLVKFSQLIRRKLEYSSLEQIRLKDELENVVLYVELQQLRFQENMFFSIEKDPDIDLNDILLPPFVIQPYVENAIIHGLLPKHQDQRLTIRINQEIDKISILIEDNGIGREKAILRKSKDNLQKTSLGMKITKNRLEMASEKMGTQTDVQIEDLKDSEGNALGTRITLRFYLKPN